MRFFGRRWKTCNRIDRLQNLQAIHYSARYLAQHHREVFVSLRRRIFRGISMMCFSELKKCREVIAICTRTRVDMILIQWSIFSLTARLLVHFERVAMTTRGLRRRRDLHQPETCNAPFSPPLTNPSHSLAILSNQSRLQDSPSKHNTHVVAEPSNHHAGFTKMRLLACLSGGNFLLGDKHARGLITTTTVGRT